MASDKFDTGVPSLLSSGLRVIGTIVSDGEIQLDGSVEGDVYCTSLVVGQDASIKGDVVARNVIVRGQVEGVIRAREVTLPNSARVEGGIVSRLISVEMGAMLNGSCQYSDDPLTGEPAAMAEHAPLPRPSPKPYSPPPTEARPHYEPAAEPAERMEEPAPEPEPPESAIRSIGEWRQRKPGQLGQGTGAVRRSPETRSLSLGSAASRFSFKKISYDLFRKRMFAPRPSDMILCVRQNPRQWRDLRPTRTGATRL